MKCTIVDGEKVLIPRDAIPNLDHWAVEAATKPKERQDYVPLGVVSGWSGSSPW